MTEQQRGIHKPEEGSRRPSDDVEGHARRIPITDDEAQDDVEGHGFRGNLQDEPRDDVDGHGWKMSRVTRELQDGIRGPGFSSGALGGDDDVEGHMPLKHRAHAEPDDQTDGAEGHAYKFRVQDEPQDDVEGHTIRGRGFTDESRENGPGPQFSSGALSGQDDVEGHFIRIRATDEPPDDAEGHGYKFRVQDDQQDDVGGHGFRGNVQGEQASDGDDDAEGHASKIRF